MPRYLRLVQLSQVPGFSGRRGAVSPKESDPDGEMGLVLGRKASVKTFKQGVSRDGTN